MSKEITSQQAARILHISRITVWRHVRDGLLQGRQWGPKRNCRIGVDALRRYAAEQNLRINERALAETLAGGE